MRVKVLQCCLKNVRVEMFENLRKNNSVFPEIFCREFRNSRSYIAVTTDRSGRALGHDEEVEDETATKQNGWVQHCSLPTQQHSALMNSTN